MLRRINWRQWQDWLEYMRAAPFSEERADFRAASICQKIVNMQRDTKAHPKPFPISEFLLPFGDYEEPKPVQQSPAYIESVLESWILGSNAAFEQQPSG